MFMLKREEGEKKKPPCYNIKQKPKLNNWQRVNHTWTSKMIRKHPPPILVNSLRKEKRPPKRSCT